MVKKDLIATMQGGRLIQKVTSVTLVNNVTLNENVSVPAGKMWKLLSVKMMNPDDVARDFYIFKYLEVARTNLIKKLAQGVAIAANAAFYWPNARTNAATTDRQPLWHDEFLAEFNTLNFNWSAGGASAGGTDADGLVLEYLEYDM